LTRTVFQDVLVVTVHGQEPEAARQHADLPPQLAEETVMIPSCPLSCRVWKMFVSEIWLESPLKPRQSLEITTAVSRRRRGLLSRRSLATPVKTSPDDDMTAVVISRD